jgi:hypothetical protein
MSKGICKYCDNTGFVSTIDDLDYEYLFKCVCKIGQNKTVKVPQWDGKTSQIIGSPYRKQNFRLHSSYRDKFLAVTK